MRSLLTIRTIIALAFTLLVILSAGTGGFAVYTLRTVSSSGETVAASMAKIDQLGELARLAGQLESGALSAHYTKDANRLSAILNNLHEDQVAFSSLYAKYSNSVTDRAELDLVRTLKVNWQHFLAVGEEVTALDKADQSDLADEVITSELGPDAVRFKEGVQSVLQLHRHAGATNQDAATAASETATWLIVIAVVTQTVLCAVIGFSLVARVSWPITRITEVMRRLAAAEQGITIPDTGRKDEIGAMAGALVVFQQSMADADALSASQADQELALQQRQKSEMLKLAEAFEQAVGEVVATVAAASTELQAAAETLSTTAEETSSQSQAVAQGARVAAQSVSEVVSSIDALATISRQVGQEMLRSSEMTARAVHQAKGTRGSMDEVQGDARTVEGVLAVIDQIAGQTNLLALNATIEAARSGEAGRGFAVVANEVKALAGQTGQATKSVGESIEKMRGSTGRAIAEIAAIEAAISEIDRASLSISEAVRQQSETAGAVTRNVHDVSRITAEVTRNIETVSSAANQSSAAASQVLSASSELAQMSERLKREVESFLVRVRAA